ncbi:hypothetical protein [Halalkalibacter urbisdiaboli]|uniref:hypothetical protein n=1 Tax=Halalkalibacter urbisdiaboli TaxID=1960589 RepID=UPI000B44AF98|nr:hypothetical protein [Halalkalibacter urbisdiaboli]
MKKHMLKTLVVTSVLGAVVLGSAIKGEAAENSSAFELGIVSDVAGDISLQSSDLSSSIQAEVGLETEVKGETSSDKINTKSQSTVEAEAGTEQSGTSTRDTTHIESNSKVEAGLSSKVNESTDHETQSKSEPAVAAEVDGETDAKGSVNAKADSHSHVDAETGIEYEIRTKSTSGCHTIESRSTADKGLSLLTDGNLVSNNGADTINFSAFNNTDLDVELGMNLGFMTFSDILNNQCVFTEVPTKVELNPIGQSNSNLSAPALDTNAELKLGLGLQTTFQQ